MRDARPRASWLDTLARPVPSDWLTFAYGVPMKWQPGERYVYSSLNAFLVGAVVEHVFQMPLASSELPGTADMACK